MKITSWYFLSISLYNKSRGMKVLDIWGWVLYYLRDTKRVLFFFFLFFCPCFSKMVKVISHCEDSPTLSGQTCRLITQRLSFLVRQPPAHVLNCSQKSHSNSKMSGVPKETEQRSRHARIWCLGEPQTAWLCSYG